MRAALEVCVGGGGGGANQGKCGDARNTSEGVAMCAVPLMPRSLASPVATSGTGELRAGKWNGGKVGWGKAGWIESGTGVHAGRQVRCGVRVRGAVRGGYVGGARIMASETASARNCDIVSSPTLARPPPPAMARTVGPAPERYAPCAPASSATLMIGSNGNM